MESPCGRRNFSGRKARSPTLFGQKIRLLGHDLHWNPRAEGMDQFGGVPVRQTKTAVGAGTGDIFRLGGAMNPVSLEGEPYPGCADGIIGARGRTSLFVIPSFKATSTRTLGSKV